MGGGKWSLSPRLLLAMVLIRLNSPLMKIRGVKSLTRELMILTNMLLKKLRLRPKRKGKKSFVSLIRICSMGWEGIVHINTVQLLYVTDY